MPDAAYPDLSGLIKADDVRGIVPDQLDGAIARVIGAAFADAVVAPEGRGVVVLGSDTRPSGSELVTAFAQGLAERGVDSVRIGLCSADALCVGSGELDAPAAMFTATRDPAAVNGISLYRAGARPVGRDAGLTAVLDLAARYLVDGVPQEPDADRGRTSERDGLRDYAVRLRSLVDLAHVRPLTVVVDAGDGMGGLTAPAVLGSAGGLPGLPIDVVRLPLEQDGTFPDREADPLEQSGLVGLQEAVVAHGADLGLAFDSDADRCVVVDETGAVVDPSVIITLVGLREVARERAAGRHPTVVRNVVTSQVVTDLLTTAGATVVRARVGRASVTAEMIARDAVFGGEHDARYYFRDLFFAGSGMLAAMHVLAALGEAPASATMSELAEVYQAYTASGEIRSVVADTSAARARVAEAYVTRRGAGPVHSDDLDGLTVSHVDASPRWWFNLRASNTEPLLRLNVEAADEDIMIKVRDDVLALVREGGRPAGMEVDS